MNLRETYNRIAEDWHADHQNDDWWIKGTDAFAAFLRPNDMMLDVGCGGGTKSDYLIKKGLRVIGIDFSEKMIEIAKREVPEGEFYVLDMRETGKLNQMFDGVFMQAALLHIPRSEAEEVIKTIAGRLKPGGYLYIAVKHKKPGRSDEQIEAENDYGYPYERFFSYFNLDEMRAYMQSMGYEIRYEDGAHLGSRWIQIIGKKV